ncbi:MAG: NAD(P)-dependent oxidoreductase [Methylococcales bacterium]|nr:NAD(P)-dependent oxidoreductase [Methylococcales bacterium]MCK5924955.1 NAD(P)-dependent oxidoreductase [Methylococcales bacterium]
MKIFNTDHRLGFIGIGLMGKPLTLRLLKAGFTVNVWNRSVEKLAAVTSEGAIAQPSITELVNASEIIILCLADSQAVKEVVEQGILGSGVRDKLIIDLSSIDPETTRKYAYKLTKKCHVSWVDAPVSGGVSGAEEGSLTIMAGGEIKDIKIAQDILEPIYKRFTHMGEVGCGQITKICNQMIVSANVLVIAEMIALAQKSGVDAAKIPQALTGGFADSKPLQITAPEMVAENFEPVKWRVKTLLKDLNMAKEVARKQGNDIPMSALAAELMQQHADQGFLEQDPSTLIKLYSEK